MDSTTEYNRIFREICGPDIDHVQKSTCYIPQWRLVIDLSCCCNSIKKQDVSISMLRKQDFLLSRVFFLCMVRLLNKTVKIPQRPEPLSCISSAFACSEKQQNTIPECLLPVAKYGLKQMQEQLLNDRCHSPENFTSWIQRSKDWVSIITFN